MTSKRIPFRMTKFLRLLCLGFFLALALGCGKHESSITGTVTFDGTPLTRGTVTFHPKAGGAAAYARIDADGNYTVKTGDQEGLKAGEYVATVVATAAPGPGQSEAAMGKLLIPAPMARSNSQSSSTQSRKARTKSIYRSRANSNRENFHEH